MVRDRPRPASYLRDRPGSKEITYACQGDHSPGGNRALYCPRWRIEMGDNPAYRVRVALLKLVRVVALTPLLSVLLLALGESPASACSCAGGRSATEAVREADVVFVGDVISVEAESESPSSSTARSRIPTAATHGFQPHGPDVVFTFEVAERRKGSVGDRQEVVSTGDAVCGVNFEVGRRYAVYARTVVGTTGPSDRLFTSLCAGPDDSEHVAEGSTPEASRPSEELSSGDTATSRAAVGGVALLSAAIGMALMVIAGRT